MGAARTLKEVQVTEELVKSGDLKDECECEAKKLRE